MANRVRDSREIDDPKERRKFMKCMAWAGSGVLWVMQGGVLRAQMLGTGAGTGAQSGNGEFSFVQLSDSHIGFHQAPNPDVTATLREAVAKVNAQSVAPGFVVHTGDLTHLAKPDQFDTLAEVMGELKTDQTFFVPGEHDVIGDDGKQYFRRFGHRGSSTRWYSFDFRGAHFIGLVNVLNFKPGGLGVLGRDQLEWLEGDLKGLSSSTPIVVFAHMPLWTIYQKWGWGTEDSTQALAYLQRFGSVTVLNGHIHQIQQKVEGNVAFYTARSSRRERCAVSTLRMPQATDGIGWRFRMRLRMCSPGSSNSSRMRNRPWSRGRSEGVAVKVTASSPPTTRCAAGRQRSRLAPARCSPARPVRPAARCRLRPPGRRGDRGDRWPRPAPDRRWARASS
jgi:Icc protein